MDDIKRIIEIMESDIKELRRLDVLRARYAHLLVDDEPAPAVDGAEPEPEATADAAELSWYERIDEVMPLGEAVSAKALHEAVAAMMGKTTDELPYSTVYSWVRKQSEKPGSGIEHDQGKGFRRIDPNAPRVAPPPTPPTPGEPRTSTLGFGSLSPERKATILGIAGKESDRG